MNAYDKLADPVAMAVFVVTLSLPILVGVAVMRRTRSQADFLLGGHAMGKLVVALSAVSSGRSSWLVLVYMVLGGFIAVANNDVVRAVIMIVGLVVFPAVGLVRAGGLDALLGTLQGLDPALIDPVSLGAGVILVFVAIGLGSPGQPHIVVRYMSIDDPRELRAAAVIGALWNVVLGWGALLIGLLGRAAIPSAEALPDADPEMAYLVLASDYFGPVMYGLLVGGIFAAILSTADSQLLVAFPLALTAVVLFSLLLPGGQTPDDDTPARRDSGDRTAELA